MEADLSRVPTRKLTYHEYIDYLMESGADEIRARKLTSEAFYGIPDDRDYTPLGQTGISGPDNLFESPRPPSLG